MIFIEPSDSKKYFEKEIGRIYEPIDALEAFLSFFHKYKVDVGPDSVDGDMLLYQYGIYDWTGEGGNFEFNLTRQFEISEEEEFLQLSLTLYYNPAIVGTIDAGNAWSIDFENLDAWISQIKCSEGFKRVDGISPDRIAIDLHET